MMSLHMAGFEQISTTSIEVRFLILHGNMDGPTQGHTDRLALLCTVGFLKIRL